MQSRNIPFVVPAEIAEDVEEIANAVRSAAEQQGRSSKDVIRITRPRTKEMVPGGVDTVFLIFGSGAAWFTKKWFDTFVWPELEKRIRKPSQHAVDFVFTNLPSSGTNKVEK